MRANYIEKFGEIPDGHWLHHLIPDNLIRNHPLGKILQKYGYDLDDASNLLAMADKEKYAELVKKNPDLIGHWSSHKEYDSLVSDRLSRIYDNFGLKNKDPSSLPPQLVGEIKKQIKLLEDELRELIKSGKAPKDKDTGRLALTDEESHDA